MFADHHTDEFARTFYVMFVTTGEGHKGRNVRERTTRGPTPRVNWLAITVSVVAGSELQTPSQNSKKP